MTTVRVLPHPELCPDGLTFEGSPGENLCELLLSNDILIEHACEMSCACTTCHVLIREGFTALPSADDLEEDMLDKAWGLEPCSRLSCQVELGTTPLSVELPRYTINLTKEGGGRK